MSKNTAPNTKENIPDSISSNLELELLELGFEETNQQCPTMLFPRLVCKVNIYKDRIILSQDGREFGFPADAQSGKALQKLFSMMDGTRSIDELQQICSPNNPEVINTIVRDLDNQGLLDDVVALQTSSGIDALSELEELTCELLDQSVEKNLFWQLINPTAPKPPTGVLYGFAIEYYHFFSRRCCFQSPILSFPASAQVRQSIDGFYSQAYGQDQLLMEALNAIGISREELTDTMALPETMAMCNGLAFWANYEPLFFLSTLGVLVDSTLKNFELYLAASEWLELEPGFIEPIRKLVNTKLKNERGNLSHCIFQEIPHIDRETRQRFRQQTYLFVEMYNNFYTAIGRHYSSTPELLRRVSVI